LPVDPARLNAVGDLVLTEARELRALADTLGLTLFDLVRREGPVATSVLAKRVDRDRAQVDENLRELEALALVERTAWDEGDVVWASDVKGIYFENPDNDPERQLAARQLSNVMLAKYAELPASWARDQEPKLQLEWARAAGLFNARIDLTASELRGIQQELERVLEPYTSRDSGDAPADAVPVRVLAFFLPEAPANA
jgi:hypothetical protein